MTNHDLACYSLRELNLLHDAISTAFPIVWSSYDVVDLSLSSVPTAQQFIGGKKENKRTSLSWIWMKAIFWQLYLWLFYIQPCAASKRGDGVYDVRTYVPSCLFVRTFVCLLSASNEPMLYLDCCLCWLGSLVVLQYLYFYMWNHLQNKDQKNQNEVLGIDNPWSFLLSSLLLYFGS